MIFNMTNIIIQKPAPNIYIFISSMLMSKTPDFTGKVRKIFSPISMSMLMNLRNRNF